MLHEQFSAIDRMNPLGGCLRVKTDAYFAFIEALMGIYAKFQLIFMNLRHIDLKKF